jgi:hypothetical protein
MTQHIVLAILVSSTLMMPAITTAGDKPAKKATPSHQ